jgi:transcriptional regulator with XRE-family HTH domain
MNNVLGERIRKLRERDGLSQKTLANKLGITQQAVAKWEGGKAEPDTTMILNIANIFDVSTDYLLGGTDNPQHKIVAKEDLPAELAEYADYIKILKDFDVDDISPEELKELIDLAKRLKGKG